jgi:hypothetical protein
MKAVYHDDKELHLDTVEKLCIWKEYFKLFGTLFHPSTRANAAQASILNGLSRWATPAVYYFSKLGQSKITSWSLD